MAEGGEGPPAAGGRPLLAVLLTTCAAHATSFLGRFQFDDFKVIVGDPRVQGLAAWWRSMPGIRPLLKLSYALGHQSGLGLAGFHAVNLAVHCAAAALALLLLDRLGRRLDPPAPRGAALAGALLFALHPVQVEAVTYLSGRSSSLSGALALASALAWVSGRDLGRRLPVHLWSPLLLACSLGVKEGAVVLPAALLLVEAADRRRPFSLPAALRAISVHLLVVAAAAAAMLAAPAYRAMLGRSLALRTPLENLLTHARATAWLAGQLVPVRGLAVDPDLGPASPLLGGAALLLLAAAAAAGLALLRRRPAIGLAACWFLLWLAPQGWWLPRPEPASERQLYLALLGPAWLAGLALCRLPGPPLRAGALAALALLLGGATALRGLVYRDEVAFWSDAAEKSPASARAHGNLGYALALACRPAEAREAFTRAAELAPGDPRWLANRRALREGVLLPEEAARRCAAAPGP
jgi:protein O-mannosyl-transferase